MKYNHLHTSDHRRIIESEQQIDCLDFIVYQIDRLQNHI